MPGPLYAMLRKLQAAKEGVNVAILGDSTGNDPTDWFRPFVAWLGLQFPAYTVTHRLWNDTTQAYDDPTVVQTGTAGDRYLFANQANAAVLTTPDTAANSLVGDIEVEFKVAFADWTPAAAQVIGAKAGAAGQRGWWLELNVAERSTTCTPWMAPP